MCLVLGDQHNNLDEMQGLRVDKIPTKLLLVAPLVEAQSQDYSLRQNGGQSGLPT